MNAIIPSQFGNLKTGEKENTLDKAAQVFADAVHAYLEYRIAEHIAYIAKLHNATPSSIQSVGWIEGQIGWRRRCVAVLKQADELCTAKVMLGIMKQTTPSQGTADHGRASNQGD